MRRDFFKVVMRFSLWLFSITCRKTHIYVSVLWGVVGAALTYLDQMGSETTLQSDPVPREWSAMMSPLGVQRPLGGWTWAWRAESRLAMGGGQVTPGQRSRGKNPHASVVWSQHISSSCTLRTGEAALGWNSNDENKRPVFAPWGLVRREKAQVDPNGLSVCIPVVPSGLKQRVVTLFVKMVNWGWNPGLFFLPVFNNLCGM